MAWFAPWSALRMGIPAPGHHVFERRQAVLFHACFLRAASLALGLLTLLFTLASIFWGVVVRNRGPHCLAPGVLATNSKLLEEALDGFIRTAVSAADFVVNMVVTTFIVLGLGAATLVAVFARLRDGTVRGWNWSRSGGPGEEDSASRGSRGPKRHRRRSNSQAAEAWEVTSHAILRTALRLQAARSSIALLLICVLLGACVLFTVAAVQRHSGAKVLVVHGPAVCAGELAGSTEVLVLPMLLPFILTVSANCLVLIAASRSDNHGAHLALGFLVVVPAVVLANGFFPFAAGGSVRPVTLVLGFGYVLHAAKPAVVDLWRLVRGGRLGRHSSHAVHPLVAADPLMAPNQHSPRELMQYCLHDLEAAGKQARTGALVILILIIFAGAAASLLFSVSSSPDGAASHVILPSYARMITGFTACLAASGALTLLLFSTHRLAVEGLFSLRRAANASAASVRLRNALHLVCYQLHLPLEAVSLACNDIAVAVVTLREAAHAALPAPTCRGEGDIAAAGDGGAHGLGRRGSLNHVTIATGELGEPSARVESTELTQSCVSTGHSAESSHKQGPDAGPGVEPARKLLRITARAQLRLARLSDAASSLRWALGSILTLDSLRHSGIVLTQEVVDPAALVLTLRQVTGAAAASMGATTRVSLVGGVCGTGAAATAPQPVPAAPDTADAPLLLADGKRLVQACLLLVQCALQCAGRRGCRRLECRLAVRSANPSPGQASSTEEAIAESHSPVVHRDSFSSGDEGAEEESDGTATQTWAVLETVSKSLPDCSTGRGDPNALIFCCDVQCRREGEGAPSRDNAPSPPQRSPPAQAGMEGGGETASTPPPGARYAPQSQPGQDHRMDEAYFRAKTLCAIVKAHGGRLRQHKGGGLLELPVVGAVGRAVSDAGAEPSVFASAARSESSYTSASSSAGSLGHGLPAHFEGKG